MKQVAVVRPRGRPYGLEYPAAPSWKERTQAGMAVSFGENHPLGDGHERLSEVVARARGALLADQHPDGHWCYELEADCTIPAEYVLFLRYLGERQPELEAKIGALSARRGRKSTAVGRSTSAAISTSAARSRRITPSS